MVDWYHKIVKYAAEHHLMVDFHGAYKPTGWRRTYPNLITCEGVLGNEHVKLANPDNYPDSIHKCTIAFTRNLLGEMDFTPGGFLNRTE
ncbi:glycoside hydrolase family 97 catalytic domain-containing protein [Candidatus Sumerlaeota bacterium]|nr:glycoside hydrolase family 97 catalytic domain-containing protein [Candidatus Sumerlaeota bacterium]